MLRGNARADRAQIAGPDTPAPDDLRERHHASRRLPYSYWRFDRSLWAKSGKVRRPDMTPILLPGPRRGGS
jgi:hypothetical protein